MNKCLILLSVAATAAAIAFCADTKALNDEASQLLKDKAWKAAAEKFIEAAEAIPSEPRRLANGFEQALRTLAFSRNTNDAAVAVSISDSALAITGLSSVSRTKILIFRITALAKSGRQKEAIDLAMDMLDARISIVEAAAAGADASQLGTPGRAKRFAFLERLLNNPGRYGIEGKTLRRLIGEYAGEPRAWGGDVLDRAILEKAEAYSVKHGLEKYTPLRLKAMREMDTFPKPEEELNIPSGLRDFGIDPDRKVVHAKDFGWNPTNVTECLTKALNSGASTVIIDDMGSPWYTRTVKISQENGSNQQIIFKKGVKIHAVTEPEFVKGDLFSLQKASNIVFIAEGELGKDVYIGQFPSREARYATGINYGGSGFGGRGNNVLLKNIWSANNLDDGFCMNGSRHYLVDCLLDNNFRQGLSVVGSTDCVYKNVTFCRTVGGEPHNGVDIEPPYEVYDCQNHYFLNCKFYDNAAGNLLFSTSNYAPVTYYFKDCEFSACRYRNISVLARLGIYTGPVQKAPSKIIFENCTIDGYSDASAVMWNTMIFDIWFKNCTFNDKGHLDPTRKPNMSPLYLSLDRGYWDGFYPKPGIVTFEDCSFNGWEGKPIIAVADFNGKLGLNSFRGKVNHNGKTVDLSRFSYMPPERALNDSEDPDLAALDAPAGAKSCESPFDLVPDAPWYHPAARYAFLFKGEKGGKTTLYFTGTGLYEGWTLHLRTPSGKERELGKVKTGKAGYTIDFDETGIHMVYGTLKHDGSEHTPRFTFNGAEGTAVSFMGIREGGVGRRIQIRTPADKPKAVGYFEVFAGKKANIKLLEGGIEILDETGKTVAKYDNGDYFGTKVFTLAPKNDAIWSFRVLTQSVKFRFFAPYHGIIAGSPETLAVTKPDLPFSITEPVPAVEIKDEAPLPIPAGLTNEVAALVAERRAWAAKGLEAKRLAQAKESLENLKKHADSDGAKREIEDVTRSVQRLTHSARAEELAAGATDEEAAMAAFCIKYATTVAPEMMWMVSLKDGYFTYPDLRTLTSLYNEVVRRMK